MRYIVFFLLFFTIPAEVEAKLPDYLKVVVCEDSSNREIVEEMYDLLPYAYFSPKPSKELDRLFILAEKAAHSGNGWSMGVYGIIKFMKLIPEDMHKDIKQNKRASLPRSLKGEMVEAISYVYLAREVPNVNVEGANKFISIIEKEKPNKEIPNEWLKEAKVNVATWKKRCGLN